MTDRPGHRIEHVVVLMLENRSFDSLFGFMNLPGSPALDPKQHPNTNPCGDPVEPSPTGRYLVRADPPHSFRGIEIAVNDNKMDGFVKAYHEKATGTLDRVVLHPWRLFLAGLALIALLVTPGGLFPRFLQVWGPVVVGIIAAGAAGFVQKPRRVLGPEFQEKAKGYLALAVLLLIAVIALSAVTVRRPAFPLGLGIVLTVLLAVTIYRRWHAASNPQSAPNPCRAIETPMRCMEPSRIPVLAGLATGFALCTNWYSSVPGETWPNRNFVHAGTSDGDVNIEIGFYESPTVFDLLDRRWSGERNWRIYYDGGIPQVAVFRNLWRGERAGNWYLFRDPDDGFADAVGRDELPKYTFIEPKHFGRGTNSQHPGNNTPAGNEANGCEPLDDSWECSDFGRGEQLVAEIYETLRTNYAVFEKTLLVITYDENGGLFDRMPPRSTTAPKVWLPTLSQRLRRLFLERPSPSFDFTETGLRVPAVVVSPWIGARTTDTTEYDHVSVIATLREVFDLADPTADDRDAASFGHLVSAADTLRPQNDLPDLSRYVRSAADEAFGAATARIEGAAAVAASVEGFAAQLAILGDLVVRELPPREAYVSALEVDSRLIADPQFEFIQRFSGNSSTQRSAVN